MVPYAGTPMSLSAIALAMKICTSDQVSGVITLGSASPRFAFVHRKSPSRLSFHTSVTATSPAAPVTGRAWRIAGAPPCSAHSTSIATPYSSSIRMPSAASRAACASVSAGRSRSSAGTGSLRVPAPVRTVRTSLVLTVPSTAPPTRATR